MRRKVVLLLALAAPLVASAAAAAGPAKLSVVTESGFTVRGAGFHPDEHVLVVVISDGGRASKRLEARSGGSFAVRFPSVHLPSCASYVVRATGDRGSRATLRVMPECAQPIAP